jgi:hypothetical protein
LSTFSPDARLTVGQGTHPDLIGIHFIHYFQVSEFSTTGYNIWRYKKLPVAGGFLPGPVKAGERNETHPVPIIG